MNDYPKFTFGKAVLPDPTLNMTPEEKAEFEEFKEYANRQMRTLIPPEPERPIPNYIIKYFMNRRNRVPYCGECCFFQNEDISGIGYCKLRCDTMRCSDQCELDHNRIGHDAAIYGLHYLQKWRRSNSDKLKMPPPYVVGKLIDAAIRKLRIYCV